MFWSLRTNRQGLPENLFNPLNANPEKWSNTLKQIVGNLPTIYLSVFDDFMNLALKGLISFTTLLYVSLYVFPMFLWSSL